MSQSLATRFWNKVEITDLLNCWRWTACTNQFGYGKIGVGKKIRYAHRIAWQLTYGIIPPGQCVCHHCDVTSCCNPSHLFLGSHKDNMADMANKGRSPRFKGELNSSSKLTEKDVLAIRSLVQQGMSQRPIAQKFGITQPNVWRIIHRITWKHI